MTTITDQPPQWTAQPNNVHTLRHGYNLTDLEKMARAAVIAGGAT